MPITASEGSARFAAAKPELDDLIKRRFFFRQAFEIYGGVGGFFTYGPPGAAVKQNLIALWRKHFVIEENLLEVDDTCIMPHDVLAASGHVERFNDFIVKDSKDPNIFFRADKLLEDVMDQRMADKACTEEMRIEYTKVKNQADAYSKDELWAVFQKHQIKSPQTGNDLTEPVAFNLMFPTPIGPVGDQQGYLRPETAQGIFLNFKFCLEQNAGQMPFGVAQVGKAFRNEIAPRAGLIRQREFTQAEIEYFCRPDPKKPHPKFASVAHLELTLFPSAEQLAAKPTVRMTLGDAVEKGMVANETLGYFVARTYLFLLRAGCKAEHLRFRQHLPDEMAHYACDCWDAEIEMSLGWVECVGIADRSAYDLTCHSKATNTSLTASQALDTPIVVETYQLTKKALAAIGKEFKKDAKVVTAYLSGLDEAALRKLEADAKAGGSATVKVDGRDFSIASELIACESKTETQHVEVFTPNVVEPSFGIDRILTAVYEHSFYVRGAEPAKEEAGGAAAGAKAATPDQLAALQAAKDKVAALKKEKAPKEEVEAAVAEMKKHKEICGEVEAPKKDKKEDKKKDDKGEAGDKAVAGVLGLPAEMAPYKVVVLPLDMRVAAQYATLLSDIRTQFTDYGLQYKVDESGASIGRRYARADELGIPYAITIDFDTIGTDGSGAAVPASPLVGTATLRDRDSTDQVRLPLADLPEVLSKLCTAHPLTWAELYAAKAAGAAGAAASAAASSDSPVDYLNSSGVTAKLNAAVNALALAKPADPIAFLMAELKKSQ